VQTDKNLRALAKELKIPLTTIASEADLNSIESIARKARDVMTLLDGYLLAAQTEYGQVGLQLETTGVGSILYEASLDVKELAKERGLAVSTSDDSSAAVMTHKRGLKIALGCLAQLALETDSHKEPSVGNELCFVAYERRNGKTVAGVLSGRLSILPQDIKRANVLYGDSHLALSTQASGSGIRLAIAQQLAYSLGARLMTLRRKGMQGIGLELIKSEQMQLV